MKTVLISGVSGFLGKALAERMSKRWKVIGISRKPSSQDYEIIGIDLAKKVPDIKADVFVHMAALADPARCRENPDEAWRTNVEGTRNMLEAAKSCGAERFVYASTGGIYGFRDGPARESDKPLPFDEYTKTKYEGERLCMEYSRYFPTTALRYFFPYGPGSNEDRLVSRLFRNVQEGSPVHLNRGGRPVINPIFLDDAVHAAELACSIGPKGALNIGGLESINIEKLSMMIGDVVGKKPVFMETGKDSKDLIGDISKAESTMGFRSKTGLGDGLRRTYG
jgi:UDP-glucose 4-epimerase